jgi:hypothetical protein
MYQYTTTNVINSAYALDYNGNILIDGTGAQVPKYAGTATTFNVAKVGSFKKTGIVSIYKRPYTQGVLEVAKLTVTTQTAGDLLRLTILIKQSQATPSEYVNYTLDFQKPVVVEVISSGVAATDATALVAQLNTLRDRFGYAYVTASLNGAEIIITAKEYTQRFKEYILSEAIANVNSLTQYDQVTLVTGVVTTPGALGFGDDSWMQRSVMLPTLENTRFFGISKDERPIMGGQYTEYALRYSIPKDGNDGTWGNGTSVTTHIFYVLSTLQVAFETALNITFPGIIEIAGPNVLVITGDSVLDLSLAETTTLVASGGTAPYSFVSGTLGTATITTPAGVVTAVGVGTTIITATDAAGKTGTFLLQVVA